MKSLLTALLIVCTSPLLAQTWTYTSTTGPQEDMSDFRNGCALIGSGPMDDVLTGWQTLPFSWMFGDTSVNGYFISDNGYITFDPSATVSDPDNAAGNVHNAIFAFWDDLFLEGGHSIWSNEVRTKTTGVAPDRRHIIMWVSAVPKGSSWSVHNVSFALVLYEKGGFEIVQIAGKPSRNMSGTMGAINADGSVLTLAGDSPDLEYPSLTADPNDDIRTIFTWSQSALDAALETLDVPAVIRHTESVSVTGTVRNSGSETITSFRVGYSINGSGEQVLDVDNLTLRSNQTHAFVHPVRWTPDAAGSEYILTCRIFDINGGDDEVAENNTLSTTIFTILGITSPKRVLVEEFTGAWCGWCPDGMLQVERVRDAYPDAIAVAIHAGGNDAMIIPAGSAIAQAFTPAYPTAMIDRVKFEGEKGVAISRGNEAWVLRTGDRRQTYTPLSVNVTSSYDAARKRITARVVLTFSDYAPPADYRVHCWLVHDKLTGSGSGWNQANYFSGNTTYRNHPFYSLPNPVPDFEHRHVLRASATGSWGDESILPDAPAASSEWEALYHFDYDAEGIEENLSVVAFITTHSEDVTDREVLNAGMAHLRPLAVEAVHTPDVTMRSIHPQPADQVVQIEVGSGKPGLLRLDVFDMLGRCVYAHPPTQISAGTSNLNIPVSRLANGPYLIRLSEGGQTLQRHILVAR
ncbi:MAG: Omp28-related outer membrane protein [Bacteroidia bacterium]|nr:Omp28-related outer membrane protein [Bacteroidia bacterium]